MLCVNDAILNMTGSGAGALLAAAVFSLDPRWVSRRRDFLEGFRGEKYLAVPCETFPPCGGISGAVYLQRSHARGLSDDPEAVCTGGHSGYGALGIAYTKRARRVFLIGYDLNPVRGRKDLYRFWADNYWNALPQLQARGVEVFNCNRGSAIDAFPYADPDSVN